jgi:large subunit ribosomal protein L18
MASKNKADIRRGVHSRIRKKVRGTSERPRLAVFRSVNHIYAQVIDDDNGKTLAAASTTEKALGVKSGGNVAAAETVGKAVAKRALAAGVSQVVYDRGGYVYHGRVKALIDATRVGLDKDPNDVSDEDSIEDSTDKSTLSSVASTVGSIFGAVTGAISTFVEDVAEASVKESDAADAQETGDKTKTQTDKVKNKAKEEKNENE